MKRVDYKEVLEKPEVLEREAERFGKNLSQKERQVREMYATVLKSKDLSMVSPRVKYQAAKQRDRDLDALARYVVGLVSEVRKKEGEEFEKYRKSLLNFLEAVVAYARYYKAMEREDYSWR